MFISEIARLLDAEIVVGGEKPDLEVSAAFSSDLMSDVLAYVREGTLLITGLVSPHTIRTCEMLDTRAVVFVRGKQVPEEVRTLAEENGMRILTTKLSMYETSGILWQNNLAGEVLHE
ncbi:MAG: DRTGG domain-containing protein [Christensenellales bacterium]